MAFSAYYTLKFYLLFEVVLISGIASEVPSSWEEHTGPLVLVRLKRTPQRAFTFSGFNPSNGLTALATSAEYFPQYYNYRSLSPSYNNFAPQGQPELESPSSSSSNSAASDYSPNYQPASEYPSSDTNNDNRSLVSQNLTPPSEQAPNTSYNQKKYKKKPYNADDDDDDDDDGRSKSKSTSNASFNAWFPIMLGMYPSRGNSNSYKDDADGVSSKGRPLGSTVIANSVSHGRSSVASSHAIAYGGEPSMKSYSKG